MDVFIGLDVSLASTAICVLGEKGKIVTEARVASAPESLVAFMRELPHGIAAVGLEAGPLSNWLHKGLTDAGFEAVLMETRQVKAALKAMPIKTDRRDAEGIARLLQMGWFRPVHCKSVSSQEMRALLTSRRSVLDALTDLELSLRGVLRNFGLKMGQVSKGRYEARVRELIAGNAMLEAAADPILRARAGLRRELAGLEKLVRNLARQKPGVPPLDDHAWRRPHHSPDLHVRDRRSRAVPAIEGSRPLGGTDPGPEPIRRTGSYRPDHQGRRCRSALCALSGRHGDAEPRGAELAEGLGAAPDNTAGQEARKPLPWPGVSASCFTGCGGMAPSSASRVKRRWHFRRHRRGCIPSAVSKEERAALEGGRSTGVPSPGRGSR